jgi:hypothetical protein
MESGGDPPRISSYCPKRFHDAPLEFLPRRGLRSAFTVHGFWRRWTLWAKRETALGDRFSFAPQGLARFPGLKSG